MKRRLAIAAGLLLLAASVASGGAQSASSAQKPATAGRPAAADKPKPLTVPNRLDIVRALASEYATVKQPLPASHKMEEALVVGSTGVVDEKKLRNDLANRGAAVHTGETVQVTAIQFKRNYILFEINGGGKKKKKWYQRIQVSAGMEGAGPAPPATTSDSGQAPPPSRRVGSWVMLTFPDYVPDLPAEEVKRLLAGVLDFSPRSAAVPWIETIPEEFREAIKEKKAKVGMNREMVLAAMGRPQNKVREVKDGVEREDWIYGNPPFVTFVTFVEDKVVEVREHN